MTTEEATLRVLVALVERLRRPDGCPWDREQGLPQLRPYLLEEAHEVAAAIDDGDWRQLAGELGDLLFQVAFVVRLAEEGAHFTLEQVIAGARRKMIERHPHVFGEEVLEDAGAVRRAWERRKAAGRTAAGEGGDDASIFDGVPRSLPSLVASYRITQRAAAVGFDWPHPRAVLAKVAEEVAELDACLDGDRSAAEEELGDLLFAAANLARHLDLDPDATLAGANRKFTRRFAHLEHRLREQGKELGSVGLEELEALWQEAKQRDARRE